MSYVCLIRQWVAIFCTQFQKCAGGRFFGKILVKNFIFAFYRVDGSKKNWVVLGARQNGLSCYTLLMVLNVTAV